MVYIFVEISGGIFCKNENIKKTSHNDMTNAGLWLVGCRRVGCGGSLTVAAIDVNPGGDEDAENNDYRCRC